jgi:hypothetical protein
MLACTMVRLAYGPDVPRGLLDLVEFHGKNLGLPLHLMERMGQSVDEAERFIVASERGLGLAFAMNATYGQPFDALLGAEVRVADPFAGLVPR